MVFKALRLALDGGYLTATVNSVQTKIAPTPITEAGAFSLDVFLRPCLEVLRESTPWH